MGRPIKNLASLFSILFLSFLLFSGLAYSTQKTFVLDPDNPIFRYEGYALNNTNTSEDLIFSGNQNITRYITIPKNSTILDSNITLLGKIIPSQSTGTGVSYYSVAIGNVTSDNMNEIAIGTYSSVILLNKTMSQLWSYGIGGEVYGVVIDDVNGDTGGEVVAGSKDTKIYMLNSTGNLKWSFTTGKYVWDVDIGDIDQSSGKEIIGGTNNGTLYVLNSTGNHLWTYNAGGAILSVKAGNITASDRDEIVIGTDEGKIYLLNSTGSKIWDLSIGSIVNSVSIDDITSDSGNEIITGCANGTIYVLNSSSDVKWTYDIGDEVYSVSSGDVTSDIGNEIAIGSRDNKVYVLNSTGNFVWSYSTGDDVRGVTIGDITSDPLNETVIASIDKNVYVLNFDYYPTNTSIDIGGNGDYDWTYTTSEKLRTYTNIENSSMGQALQSYLDSCNTQNCNIPLVFNSYASGNLEITSINITYNYNASEAINSQTLSNTWSRTNNIYVNTSLGYQVKNISYTQNPANSITVNYVKVDNSATSCDFGGLSYSVTTAEGVNTCDVTDYSILSSGGLPSTHRLWDNTMSTAIPAFLNTTAGQVNATGIWIKYMTIYTADDTETLYNVTANTTADESYVTSDELLFVDWYNNGTYYDITSTGGESSCDTNDPTYTTKTIGSDIFYVCKEDTNSNGVFDFFKWKQPHTSSRNYKLEGSSNYPLELTNRQVNSTSSPWETAFNFSVDVKDPEGNNATVSLWIYFSRNSSWEKVETKNITTNGTAWFVATSDRYWTGNNQYKFEYTDFNDTSGAVLHLWQNTSASQFDVTKHTVYVDYFYGHNSNVNRTGTNSTELIVRVNDTLNVSYVEADVNCSFWITTDGSTFILAKQTSTNSTGYCNFTFDPNSTYQAYNQIWKAGVNDDAFYNSTNSSEYNVKIHVPINISFHSSTVNQNVTRGGSIYTTAAMYDENNNPIPVSGYTCTFYINNSQVPGNPYFTNSSGYCYYPWSPTCSNSTGIYPINVSLSGSLYDYYYIINDKSSTNIRVKDTLNISIILPVNQTIVREQETVNLNSTMRDSCGIPDQTYTVGWYFEKSESCPSSNPVATGDNTSWSLAANCGPRQQIIIANATGDSYVSSKAYAKIFIYGWSEVNITSPTAGNITNRIGGESVYFDLICQAKDNITALGIQSYPVSFFDGSTFIGTNTTNSTGHAKYRWNITSNVTVPEGNHTIKCNISSSSILYYNVSINESASWMIIRSNDASPPFFTGVHASSIHPYNNITLEANVTDWFGVDKVWFNITYPNSTTFIYFLQNLTSNLISATWRTTIINASNEGSYDYTVYANDTSGQLNSTTGWFDVYDQIYFWGNATNKDNKNIALNFTFYRAGTNKTIEIPNTSYINGGSYNFSVFKTNVDLKLNVIDHTILLRNVNITSSAISQFGENATNITNPLVFDNVSVSDILLQSTTKNKMIALAIDSNLEFDNATITINFTRNLNDYSDLSKPALRIYKCSSWQLDNRTGCDGSWAELTSSLDSNKNTISTDVTSMSGYVVAETCPSCGGSGTGNQVNLGGGGGGGSGAQCGNGKCEVGENVDNCPKDCGKAERPPFTIKTNLTDVQVEAGKSELYALWIKNTANKKINTSIYFSGSTFHFLAIDENFVELDVDQEKMILIYTTIPVSTDPAVYTGEVVIKGEGYTQRVPITITVPFAGTLYLDVVVESLTKKVNPNGTAIFHILVYNLGFRKKVNITIDYIAKELVSGNIIYREIEERTIEASLPLIKNVHIPGNATLGDYSYEVEIEFYGQKISSADTFQVVKPFWTPERLRFVLLLVIFICCVIVGYYIKKLYKDWRLSKVRYIFPVDSKTLPKGELWIGEIAETDQKATFEMIELKTHVLTAGATGSGKSVSAMTIAEELLEKKIPIVVFDPTAQWTGFVRPCKDINLLKFYKNFNMNLRDVKPYKGMIYEVTNPKVKIDFKKYMNPGEITIFTMNKLKPGEYDQAVKTIVDTIFEQTWEESTDLQLVIVFDEVHRLLEKYGGKGGYVALERACREFRKWGIGLIMISQVLSDFKEAIKGNVLTEIQLHTKSLGDLQRIEQKFGEDYAKKVTRLEVGIGMVQNPKYNKGKPYFVNFRPTYHSPHKIPDNELQMYKEYDKILEEMEEKIGKLKKSGKDVFSLNVELNLAKDKLKKGRFNMAKIYIDSLTKSLIREEK